MSFLHASSNECLKSELHLFELPPTQTTLEASRYIQYKPISSLTDDSPIEFVIPGAGEEYLDLAHTMINLRVSIQLPGVDKAASGSAPQAGPVNNFLHSLFSQVDIYFNQKPVSPPNNHYAYRAYIESLLNYGAAAKDSHLSCSLWKKDTAGKMDAIDEENTGLSYRRGLMGTTKSIDLIGYLHCDVFKQEKLLLNGIEVRIRLVKSRDNFAIMSNADGAFARIEEANLLVRRVKISPSVLLSHEKALSKTTAKYPLTRVEVKTLTIHSGVHGETLDNVILGQLPKRLIIGFVSNKAFNGDRSMNPFNFTHCNINFLCLYVDGVQIPSKPLQPDFTKNKQYVEAYHTLFTGTGVHYLDSGNEISRDDYPNGYCLFAFDLSPDLAASCTDHWSLVRHGSIRVDVRFEKPLIATINCLVYAEYDNILEVDASRQVLVDFAG